MALVTGGSRGIGGAIADRLASEGWNVHFSYFQDHDAADARVRAAARRALQQNALQRDLRSHDEVRDLVAHVAEREGRIDALIANAASGVFGSLETFTEKHWQWTMDVNARSFLWLVQAALPWMRRGGRIVALTSLGARRAIPGYGLVGASKGALESMVRHMAVELAPRGIAVNAVSPGLVPTTGVAAFLDPEAVENARRRTPAGRLVVPADVAGVVSFLCSRDAAMIHGQTICIDGGFEAVA